MATLILTNPDYSHVCRNDEDVSFLREIAADYYTETIEWEFNYHADEEIGYINYEKDDQEIVARIII